MLQTSLREEVAVDEKLTKLAKSLVNLRAKSPKKSSKAKPGKKSGVMGVITDAIQKVTG